MRRAVHTSVAFPRSHNGAHLTRFPCAPAPKPCASPHPPAGVLPGGQSVAIKVQRPGIAADVAADAWLLRAVAGTLEGSGAVKAKAVAAVDEFCSRIFEEMDFRSAPPTPEQAAQRHDLGQKRLRSVVCPTERRRPGGHWPHAGTVFGASRPWRVQ